jgi:NADH-quinone oxidoreductase subunit E
MISEPTTLDLSPLDGILEKYAGQKGAIIPILQHAQEVYGYLPPEVLKEISQRTHIPLSRIYGVATFYAQFYLTQRGRHVIRVCDGTACHVRGAAKIIDELGNDLHILPGQTTDDYRVSYEVVYCLGSCGLAPVAVVDEHVEGRLTPAQLIETARSLK